MVSRRRGLFAAAAVGVVLVLAGAAALFLRPPVLISRPLPDPVPVISGGDFPTPAPSGFPAGMRVVVPELRINLEVVPGDGYNAPLYRAATYPGLKLPGQGGRSLIYAHAQDGMFGNLLLRGAVGDHVEIHEPGGRVLRYVVTRYVRRWPISDPSILQPANHEELVLLTCTSYNLNDPRVVAIAEPA